MVDIEDLIKQNEVPFSPMLNYILEPWLYTVTPSIDMSTNDTISLIQERWQQEHN